MNQETQNVETQPDLLSEYDISLVDATRGQRFLNFLIDNILMRFGVSYLTGIVVGLFLAEFFPSFLLESQYSGSFAFVGLLFIIAYVNYVVYYTLCEKLFQGHTLGKLITGTKAVRENGDALTFKDALLRSLSRIVPFEAFSGFGIPWHDSWTDTRVIKTR